MSPPSKEIPRKRRGIGTARDEFQLYKAAVNGVLDAFISVDAEECIIEWNDRAKELFGWSADEVLGKTLSAAIGVQEASSPLLGTVAEPEKTAHTSKRQRLLVRRRDGERFTAEMQIARSCIKNQSYSTIFIRDISDTLFAEQQLVQAQKLEAIGHLTGGLAHDFNNILGIIIGSLDLISPNVTGEDDRELLSAAQSAAHRGADITRALLAVARRRALKPQATNVNELIDELVPLLRQSAGKRVEVTFSANALNAVCNIDAGGLNNALVNLVINARDAMPEGGQILIYAYTTEVLPQVLAAPLELKPGPYLVVGVDDTGSGMSPEVAMQAFDPFFTTKDRGRGTGLGLAMVYGFARQSGGTAIIQSAPGRGTSVQLLLPIVASATTENASPKPPATAPVGHARILFVDDEPLLLRVASEWLTSLGHTVTTAASADDALGQLAQSRFDILVSDIVMPGTMDGLSLVERCRRLYPEMPALLTTGFADGLAAALRTRSPVLDKPYTRTTLGQAVIEALQAGR